MVLVLTLLSRPPREEAREEAPAPAALVGSFKRYK